jgi:WD40 repeat protein
MPVSRAKYTPLWALTLALVATACSQPTPDPTVSRMTVAHGVDLTPGQCFSVSPSGTALAWVADVREADGGAVICRAQIGADTPDSLRGLSRSDALSFLSNAWQGDTLAVGGPAWNDYAIAYWPPTETQIFHGSMDFGSLTCVDCPTLDQILELVPELRDHSGRARALLDISIVPSSGGRVAYFTEDVLRLGGRLNAILRREVGRDDEVVLVHKAGLGQTYINSLRVSPDGRFLAFSADSQANIVIPVPSRQDRIWILNLETHSKRLIGTAAFIGNLMWSSDSQRLYAAGRDSSAGPGSIWEYRL